MKNVPVMDTPSLSDLPRITVKGLAVIGKGASAAVYALDESRVLKVYDTFFPLRLILQEFRMTELAYQMGVRTIPAYMLVNADGAYGAVYGRLNGVSLLNLMRSNREELVPNVRHFGRFVRKSHEITLPTEQVECGITEMLENLREWRKLGLSETEREKFEWILGQFPESCQFSHGDCHAGNVIVQDGEYSFIDIGRMTRADPLLDDVSMYCQFRLPQHPNLPHGGSVSPNAKGFTPTERQLIWNTFFEAASGITDSRERDALEKKLHALTSVRMMMVKLYKPHFFREEAYRFFIREAVEYYDSYH